MSESVRESSKKPEADKEERTSQTRTSDSYLPTNSSVDRILFLQRTIGNQAVGRLIKSGALQAKSKTGQPDDIHDHEADRVAEQVMCMLEPAIGIDRAMVHQGGEQLQMARAQARSVQRQVDFGSMYKNRAGKVMTRQPKGGGSKDLMDYEEYKQTISKTVASSASGGHMLAFPITRDELLDIFDGLGKDFKEGKVDDATVNLFVDKLEQAFRVMKLDTVEVQASFLANAYSESAQFRYMTETQNAVKDGKPYQTNPSDVPISTTYLDCAAEVSASKKGGQPASDRCKKIAGTNVIDYETGGSINPEGDWQKSFIGRGPIQVTHRHFYVQALAVLEKRAEELKAENPDSQDYKDLQEAIDMIKTDPREAANPKYAFLFSAGFMKMPDVSGIRGDVKATQGQVTSWMGRQPADAKRRKDAAYARAYKVLMDRWNFEQEIANMMFAGQATSEVTTEEGSTKTAEEALDNIEKK